MLIVVLLLGWYFYSNRRVVSFENKHHSPDEIKESIRELDFEVNLPAYMPDGAYLQWATTYTTNGQSLYHVMYAYDNIGFYHFYSSYRTEPIESVIEKDSGYNWVEIEINGKPALKAESEYDHLAIKRVMFKTDKNIYYEIASPTLDIEEMIKILESI